MEDVLVFFLLLHFHLVGCGNQRGCVPNDIHKKIFAALIPGVKTNQRVVQKTWRSVFYLLYFLKKKKKKESQESTIQ